ncbi:hypothetical protein Btru_046887 [Bulinus truncatus]|nr:hypothetical protein Btru_046887 [Bulinus truncatus]
MAYNVLIEAKAVSYKISNENSDMLDEIQYKINKELFGQDCQPTSIFSSPQVGAHTVIAGFTFLVSALFTVLSCAAVYRRKRYLLIGFLAPIVWMDNVFCHTGKESPVRESLHTTLFCCRKFYDDPQEEPAELIDISIELANLTI